MAGSRTIPVRSLTPTLGHNPPETPLDPDEPQTPQRHRTALALRERLPLWVQTHCGLQRRSVIALSALLALVLTFAVQHFWAGRTEPVEADPGELHLMQGWSLTSGPELREVYRLAA